MERNLHSYVLHHKQWDDARLFEEFSRYQTLFPSLEATLYETHVVEGRGALYDDTDEIIQSIDKKGEYFDVINNMMRFLVINRVNNALKTGYVDHTKSTSYTNDFFNPSNGFQANVLKSPIWQCIYEVIGVELFLKLLLGCSVFLPFNGRFQQLCGALKTMPFNSSEIKEVEYIPCPDVFPESYIATVQEVIDDERYESVDKLPAKFEGLKSILKSCYARHSNFRYSYHLGRLRGPKEEGTDWLHKEKAPVVLSFCLFATERIFSNVVWGSDYNKRLLFRMITKVIKVGHKSLPTAENLANRFRCIQVSWVGNTRKTRNNDDLSSRKRMLAVFLSWYFHKFLDRLINRYWKRVPNAETGGKFQIDYYTRKKWSECAKSWVSDYVESYLYKSNDEYTNIANQESSFVGRIKLVPKKDGFRMLCIPLKSRPLHVDKNAVSEGARYGQYNKKVMKPLQYLLTFKDRELVKKMSEFHPRSYSQQDVAYHVNKFRSSLKKEDLDSLFILKFDMKHCYDNMDQDLLLKSVEKLFEDDPDDKAFYVSTYTSKSMISTDRDTRKFEVKDSDNIAESWDVILEQESKINSRAALDQGAIRKFYKKDVFCLVRDYVEDSAIFIDGISSELYKRKKGIFQGFPLSATLCNIYYNQLVDKELNFLLGKGSTPNSILLRLVDDFLYISTVDDRNQLFEVLNSANLKNYGAILNKSKTTWYPPVSEAHGDTLKWEELLFVGLDVDSKLLVKPHCIYDPTRLAIDKCGSMPRAYSLISWWFKTQLKPYTISVNYGVTIAYLNVKRIWIVLMQCLDKLLVHYSREGHETSVMKSSMFVLELVELTASAWNRANKSHKRNQIIATVKRIIMQESSKSETLEHISEIVHYI